jgi:hypothetical protein
VAGRLVQFRQVKPELFFGYRTVDGVPTAPPEKAILDLAYLVDLGRETWPVPDLAVTEEDLRAVRKVVRSLSASMRLRVERALQKVSGAKGGT